MTVGNGQGRGRYARPDASMSLLTNLMEHSLDEGYAEAAARRRAAGDTGPDGGRTGLGGVLGRAASHRPRLVAAVGLGVVALLLTVAAVQTRATAPQAARERQALVAQVQRDQAAVNGERQQLQQLQQQIDQQQAAILANSDSAAAGNLRRVQLLSGATAVQGPGVSLTLNDALTATASNGGSDPRADTSAAAGRIEDVDLQRVVNGLWTAGAEAVAVNGERLTARSAIRSAGGAILVNFTPLTAPYTVEAIGDPNHLLDAFEQTPDGRYLSTVQELYGIQVATAVQQSLQLPAATTLLDLRQATVPHATPTGRAASTPTVSPTHGATPSSTRAGHTPTSTRTGGPPTTAGGQREG